jgi:hypothetical protein
MNYNHKVLWLLKNYKFYTLYTLILSNLPHLTVGSKLVLSSKMLCKFQSFLNLCLGLPKDAIKILAYCVL